MIIHGKDIIIKADGEVIAAAKSCELDISAEVIKTASPTDGQWQHGIAGRKSWRATCNHLVTDILDPVQMVGVDVTLTINTVNYTLTANGLSEEKLTGDAIVKEWRLTATRGNLAQGSFRFEGVGPLE